jgi:small subunit ribosomal protein S16
LLKIRLSRIGRKNKAIFRVVLAEKQSAVKSGSAIEVLGHYYPANSPKKIDLNLERIKYWVSKGAQPSSSVASLCIKAGASDMQKYLKKPLRKQTTKKKAENAPTK